MFVIHSGVCWIFSSLHTWCIALCHNWSVNQYREKNTLSVIITESVDHRELLLTPKSSTHCSTKIDKGLFQFEKKREKSSLSPTSQLSRSTRWPKNSTLNWANEPRGWPKDKKKSHAHPPPECAFVKREPKWREKKKRAEKKRSSRGQSCGR